MALILGFIWSVPLRNLNQVIIIENPYYLEISLLWWLKVISLAATQKRADTEVTNAIHTFDGLGRPYTIMLGCLKPQGQSKGPAARKPGSEGSQLKEPCLGDV